MAKDKKRGFFSWLGFGNNSKAEEPTATDNHEQDQVATQAVADHDDHVSSDHSSETAQQQLGSEPLNLTETHQISQPNDADQPPVVEESHDQQNVVETHQPLAQQTSVQQTFAEQVIEQQQQLAGEVEVHHAEQTDIDVELALEPLVVELSEQTKQQNIPVVEPQQQPDQVEPNQVQPLMVEAEPEIIQTAEPAQPSAQEQLIVEQRSIIEEKEIVEQQSITQEQPIAQEQQRPTKEGFFARLKRSLLRTKQNLGSGFISLFRGKKIDDDLFEELEEQLLIADVGVQTTGKIINSLVAHADRKQLKDADALYGKLREEMSDILQKVSQPLDIQTHSPFVILMVGVNGVGKTTTIGKLARQFEAQGKSVMLAAGDTFRAAAVEQLQVWGDRNHIPVIAQHTGADSASVIFDALQAAKARKIDVLIADTAGRLQNKSHLMEELKKIVRVLKKMDENAPHEIMLTIDASTGQNAVSQAKLFHEAVGLTGITLTKLDGTAKGGVIFAVADQFSIPIRYIGVGEGIEDLRPFHADDFIEALFARDE